MTSPIRKVSVPVDGEGRSPLYTVAYESIRKGAPGLSDTTCQVIARAINMKLTTAPVREEGGAVTDAMVEAACFRFVSESDDIWSGSVWPEGPDDDGSRGDGGRVRLISEDDQHNIRAAMRFALTDALAPAEAGEPEALRMAYKTGYQEGVEDSDGNFCRDACEEGWGQYLETLRVQPQAREEAGSAEPEVGRAVYERIEKLIGARRGTREGEELDYLSHLVASVEEVGGYDGPQAREEAPPVGVAEALNAHETCATFSKRDVPVGTPLYDTPPAPEAEKLRMALEWYGEQARLARLIHSEGDKGRQALADDGGKRARQALAVLQQQGR